MSITFRKIELELLNETFIKEACTHSGYSQLELKKYIITSIEEAKYTVSLIKKYPLQNKIILEFGSGLGFASIMLHLEGYDITSFEPGGLGFEKNNLVNQFIKKHFNLNFILISDMAKVKDNSFDFIFSNNVLEHIENIEETILKLDKSLTGNGIMLHNVPNYIVPYEPHFGIAFPPIFPKKMSFLISKNITSTDLWKSINFINVFDVKSYAKKANAIVTFEKKLIYKIIERIDNDKEFANRHKGISNIINLLKKVGILKLIKILPVSLNTPMIFEWRKNSA